MPCLLVTLLVLTASSLSACSISPHELYLFSRVEGVVTQHGVPIPGATVRQRYEEGWTSKHGEFAVSTDAGGRFRFPARDEHRWFVWMFENPIKQAITIEVNNHRYVAWQFTKMADAEGQELGRATIELSCDLDQHAMSWQLVKNGISQISYVGVCSIPVAGIVARSPWPPPD